MYDLYFKRRIFDFSPADRHLYVIDCGANIGVTVSWWKKRYKDAEVLAFEADPEIFRVLERNCGALPGVRLLNAAVWDREGEVVFFAKEVKAATSLNFLIARGKKWSGLSLVCAYVHSCLKNAIS